MYELFYSTLLYKSPLIGVGCLVAVVEAQFSSVYERNSRSLVYSWFYRCLTYFVCDPRATIVP